VHVTIIITSYQRPEALALVLESLRQQIRSPDLIVVADDGSTPEIRHIVETLAALPVTLAWQPDVGFRAARARNLAISRIQSGYVIFIDGDCLCPPHFVSNHCRLAKLGTLVSGGRVLVSPENTRELMQRDSREFSNLFSSAKFWSLPLGILRDLNKDSSVGVKTCNMALHMDDLLMVCGFDESYRGWGLEDTDFVERLIHSGLRVRNGRLGVCVAHLHHTEQSRDQYSVNAEKLANVVANRDCTEPQRSMLMDR
jgi:glycosyltransferase involved in cell wall biosynthesis